MVTRRKAAGVPRKRVTRRKAASGPRKRAQTRSVGPQSDQQEREALIAVRDLVGELLKQVNRAFTEPSDASLARIDEERERYASALLSMALFFGKFGAPFAGRFFELASLITDLELGIRHDLLTPAIVNNRPPDSSQMWRARACVVLALDALVRTGRPTAGAAAEIARDYPQLASLINAKKKDNVLITNLSKTMIDWRKKFAARVVKNSDANDFYEIGAEIMENLARDGDQRLIEFANDRLGMAVSFCRVLSPPA
jgi:hypothetical protein